MSPPAARAPRQADGGQARQWTILALVEWTTQHLASKGFEEARLNVELLLAHVLRLRRLDLYLQFDRMLRPDELAAFRSLYERRLTHEPVQYILGEMDFMGLHLSVNPAVLIPRPETEHLVERALAEASRQARPGLTVLDIGTGSGNVALAIAQKMPEAAITSIDVSPAALGLAKANAARNGIANVTFLEADIFGDALDGRCFDVVVSNPPYVSAREFAGTQPEVREFEPADAVTDGADGLRFHARIAAMAGPLLNPGGAVLVEVGHDQAEAVCTMFQQQGLVEMAVFPDYAGIQRIVSARKR